MSVHKAPDPDYDPRQARARHPEDGPFLHILLGVYTTSHPHTDEPVNLEAAWQHVVGQKSACCYSNYCDQVELQRQYIR